MRRLYPPGIQPYFIEYRNCNFRFEAGLASSENIFGRDRAFLGMFTRSFLMLSFMYCRERGLLTHKLACPASRTLEICEVPVRELSTICRIILLGQTVSVCCVAVLLEATVQFSSSVNSKNGARISRT